MKAETLFLIRSSEEYSPLIGHLVSMLNYARWTTLQAVEGLTAPGLDHLQDGGSNSIGALLLHIAAIEFSYQLATLEGRNFTGQEWARWGPAVDLGDAGRRGIRGHDLDHYLKVLADVRETTLEALRGRDDDWLLQERPFWSGQPANHYFMWFHVLEDELNHRGQIRWLRQRLPGVPGPENRGA